MKFILQKPEWNKSPYTGMTKAHWIEICYFLLSGVFEHVQKIDDPILMPRQEYDVSYPRPDGPKWRIAAEKFEGLARTFLVAAPLLHNHPDAVVKGYRMREYYKQQILLSVTEGSPQFLMNLSEIQAEALPGEISFQHTCECASLVIGLNMCKEVIWDTYTQAEKDKIAEYLMQFGHGSTGHHNWRLFNMLILGFLDREGYEIDHGVMKDHASAIIAYYAGDGWYRDGHSFDYYCPWAFHVYGPLWNEWYGYEKLPYIANKIESYSNELVQTYPNMFDSDGHVLMWGRSGSYRSAATAPLAANFLLKNSTANAGWARRIASGALLQFITREECFYEGVPCLGFYGPFQSFVQTYSCAASPFWIANSFLCLVLPDDHAFWVNTENNGLWESEDKTNVKTTVLNGPGIVIDNHLASGITEIRTSKVLAEQKHSTLNAYSRLAFNSQFPWEDFRYEGPEAMQYSLSVNGQKETKIPNILMYCGERDGVIYRREYFDFTYTFQDRSSICLADFAVPYGVIRVDRIQIPYKPYTLFLGSYGMAVDSNIVEVITRESKHGLGVAKIMKSAQGQIAFVNYQGWDQILLQKRQGVNPVNEISNMLYGVSQRNKCYEDLPYVMVTGILTKKDNSEWGEEELFPVVNIEYIDMEQHGAYGPIQIALHSGETKKIDFEKIEGEYRL